MVLWFVVVIATGRAIVMGRARAREGRNAGFHIRKLRVQWWLGGKVRGSGGVVNIHGNTEGGNGDVAMVA